MNFGPNPEPLAYFVAQIRQPKYRPYSKLYRAFDAGFRSRYARQGHECNPHAVDTSDNLETEWFAWNFGWHVANENDQEVKFTTAAYPRGVTQAIVDNCTSESEAAYDYALRMTYESELGIDLTVKEMNRRWPSLGEELVGQIFDKASVDAVNVVIDKQDQEMSPDDAASSINASTRFVDTVYAARSDAVDWKIWNPGMPPDTFILTDIMQTGPAELTIKQAEVIFDRAPRIADLPPRIPGGPVAP